MTAWAFVGLAMLVAIALMADDKGTQDPRQDPGQDKGTDQTPAIKDGMTAAQVQELLRKESDRIDQKYKMVIDKRLAEAKSSWEEEQKTAAEREQMTELDKAKADLQKAATEIDALRQETELQQKRAELNEWVAGNAGDLDRAWRGLLLQELAAAPEAETREVTLARVREQRDQEQGTRGAPLGVVGRPGGQPGAETGQDMNRAIRQAAGRRG